MEIHIGQGEVTVNKEERLVINIICWVDQCTGYTAISCVLFYIHMYIL